MYPEGTHFIRTRVNTCSGSSGAHVFYASTGRFIGVHFAGNDQRAWAISFPEIVSPFDTKLISGIAEVSQLLGYVSLLRNVRDWQHVRPDPPELIKAQAVRLLEAIEFAPYIVKVTSGDPGVDLSIRQVMFE